MDWIRRNSFYVTWGGVALLLTALAFLFWYSGYRRNAELDEQLAAENQSLEALYRANPRPNAENVQLVRDDTARVEKLTAQSKGLFRKAPEIRLDAASFRKLLDDSIFDLNNRAAVAHVLVPTNYNYSFSVQRLAVTFSSGSLGRLAARLDDVKALCQVLFDARVYTIDSIRRSVASDDEILTSPDLLVTKPTTNATTGLVRYPYEIVFSGFTRELAKVMDGINRSADFFVIRNITVAVAPPPPAPPQAVPGTAVSSFPPGYLRPGLPAFPQQRRTPVDPDNPDDEPDMTDPDDPDMAAPSQTAARRQILFRAATTDTVLDEQLLQFTLTVDLIRAPAVARP